MPRRRYVNLSRLDEAKAVLKEAERAQFGERIAAWPLRYRLAFLKGDTARRRSWQRRRWASRGTRLVLAAQADTEAGMERLEKPRATSHGGRWIQLSTTMPKKPRQPTRLHGGPAGSGIGQPEAGTRRMPMQQ